MSFRERGALGALIGVLSAGTAIGIGEFVAAFVRPAAAPIVVVGNRLIVLTPEPVKLWAIREVGTNDKRLLLTGIWVVLAAFAVLAGWLALRRLAYGLGAIGVLAAFGVYCALSTAGHHASDVVPILLGMIAAAGVLTGLQRSVVGTGYVDPDDAAAASGIANRRRFLQGSALAAGVAAAAGFGGRAEQHTRFDATAARAKVVLPTPAESVEALPVGVDLGKSGVPFITPNSAFYRIDTALTIPQIDPATWSLRIHGMVDRELRLSYADLLARPQIERYVTMTCVSDEVGGDLISTAKFQGTLLTALLEQAGVHAAADQLVSTSSDGMTIGSPTAVVMDGRDAMLAVGMNGVPLPIEHGFPVRMVVPGLYGYVSACKWIVDVEATTFADAAAYWVQGGWAAKGPIKLASRIDTPTSGLVVAVGDTVPIAGVAWDQHVGVSKVEVQIDSGPWTTARLATVPSTDTWRQWVLPWTVPAKGRFVIQVRATDAQGQLQDAALQDPFPSGATGLHAVTVTAR